MDSENRKKRPEALFSSGTTPVTLIYLSSSSNWTVKLKIRYFESGNSHLNMHFAVLKIYKTENFQTEMDLDSIDLIGILLIILGNSNKNK